MLFFKQLTRNLGLVDRKFNNYKYYIKLLNNTVVTDTITPLVNPSVKESNTHKTKYRVCNAT